MQKIKRLLALPLAAVILTGCTNVREIGQVNGVTLTRVTTRGVFSPSTTTVVYHDPTTPGKIGTITDASGPGFIPAVANAGGVAGGAALLRPARNSTTVSSSNVSDNDGVSTGNISVHPAVVTPPPPASGHPNSPGNGGTPGNGGVNNPNN